MLAYLHPGLVDAWLLLDILPVCCTVCPVLCYRVALNLPLYHHSPPATSTTTSFQDCSARLHSPLTLLSGGTTDLTLWWGGGGMLFYWEGYS
jgi:hypothetical protein